MPPQDLSRLRRQRDAALAAALEGEDHLRSLDAALARAQRAGQAQETTRLRAEQDAARQRVAAARADHTRIGIDVGAGLADWLAQTPEQIVGTCADDFPFVLLPVRIETKFARTGQATELRVRMFPDAISVAAPVEPPSPAERALGLAYWSARSAASHASGDEARRRAALTYKGTWAALAAHAGANRAGFIVRETTPEDPQAAPGDLRFADPRPAADPIVTRAEGLPDRFVVLAYRRDPTTKALHEVGRAVGAPVPDDLALAPDPAQTNAWLSRDPATGTLVFPEALRWMVDFDAAVAAGMALRLPVPPPHDVAGFDRLIALGVRGSTAPDEGPATLERLFTKHRYHAGMGLVRAGTPTNNSEQATSGTSDAEAVIDELFAVEDAPLDLTSSGPVTDGRRLRDVFGLSNALVEHLPQAKATDITDALAMNRAMAPGTLNEFVAEFLEGVVGAATARRLDRFFTTWVSGRGLYPALRIGRQPYGIVVTSAWKRWVFPGDGLLAGREPDIAPAIHSLIDRHRFKWELLASNAPHAAQRQGDPFQRLLGIIGLLASSVAFVSRKAVSDEYIRHTLSFGGPAASGLQAWFDDLRAVREPLLAATDFPAATGANEPLLRFILFLQNTSDWRIPLVDRDPALPLSEVRPIGAYDGERNYLHWLTQASREDVAAQRFVDRSGAVLPPPAAMLYVLLRHALLASIEDASVSAARLHGAPFFDVVEREPLVANIGDAQHVRRRDYLEVDAARLGLAAAPTALGDWALGAARDTGASRPSAVARLAEVHDAIAGLAGLPTAQLERLLTEHVDLCSYRLDAWITALYSQRLAGLQARSQTPSFHLGSFGWVEHLRPALADRTPLAAETLPEGLRETTTHPVYEDRANGGYIHAPSLAQAATAAVMRNGYLSHTDEDRPEAFAVNLSSASMRASADLLAGVRAGQPIAALLGYQLERGLHEGHAGVELDRHIGALRDQFPLISGRLSAMPPGTNADTIEARNVVDGLALVEAAARSPYPYGVPTLPAAGSPAALAIAAEVDRLRDALDAVSDAMLAESVHQAVQGNVTRTVAAQEALTSPAVPPEPEVIRTPRSGRVLTFRAVLALDADGGAAWSQARSPRALANASLNDWLVRHLPSPDMILWSARIGDAHPVVQSLAGLGLEPLDLVLMSGDRLGDSSSELERYLVHHLRWAGGVRDDQVTTFDFSAAVPGGTSLAALQPLLARLRRLFSAGRGTTAADWRPSTDRDFAEPNDPGGTMTGHPRLQQLADLEARVDRAAAQLTAARQVLVDSLDALAPLRVALAADGSTSGNPAWDGALQALQRALFDLVLFGMPEALPTGEQPRSAQQIDRLAAQASLVLGLVDDRLRRAALLASTAFADPLPAGACDRAADAARALLGSALLLVPLFRFAPDQAAEIGQALGTPAPEAAAVDAWMHSAARVRPRLTDLTWALAALRWTGHAVADPAIVQLPYRTGTPWIGGRFGPNLPPGEWLSLVVLNSSAVSAPLQAGLLVDEWTEVVPADRETTGVAFNVERPNAVAPQAVLVAVPPQSTGHWSWDDLVGSVHEALDLAKLRAVEPDALIDAPPDAGPPAGQYFQLLPAILAEFTAGRTAATNFDAVVAESLVRMED